MLFITYFSFTIRKSNAKVSLRADFKQALPDYFLYHTYLLTIPLHIFIYQPLNTKVLKLTHTCHKTVTYEMSLSRASASDFSKVLPPLLTYSEVIGYTLLTYTHETTLKQ